MVRLFEPGFVMKADAGCKANRIRTEQVPAKMTQVFDAGRSYYILALFPI